MRPFLFLAALVAAVLVCGWVAAESPPAGNQQPPVHSGASGRRIFSSPKPAQPAVNNAPADAAAVLPNAVQPQKMRPPREASSRAPIDSLAWRDHGNWHYGHQHHHGGNWSSGGFPGYWGFGYAPYFPAYRTFGFVVVNPPWGGAVSVANPLQPNLAPGVNLPAPADPADPAGNPPADPAPLKVTHPEQKARAGRFLQFGDTNFSQGRYLAAVERYKTAMTMAPDVAEPYFRQAFAYVAMGRYESAAKAFRRGLRVRADWSGSPFRIDQLYDGAAVAKTAHLEQLAKAVEANPLDSELLLVLGLELFFDGQADRAEAFITRYTQLSPDADEVLDTFLARPQDGGAAPPAPGGKIAF